MCYLLHFSTAVLYLIDCCTALHNCSNTTVRYKITCWYSNRIWFLPIRIPASYFVSNSRIRKIMQCSAAVHQIAHKGSIQLTILRLYTYHCSVTELPVLPVVRFDDSEAKTDSINRIRRKSDRVTVALLYTEQKYSNDLHTL